MNNLEKKIIALLKEDARYSAQKIAVMLGATETEVAQTIKDLENKPPLTDEASAIIISNLNNHIYASLNNTIKSFTETLQSNSTLLKEGKYKAPELTQTIYNNLQILNDWLTANLTQNI